MKVVRGFIIVTRKVDDLLYRERHLAAERVITGTESFQKRRHTIHVHPLGNNPCNEISVFGQK